MSNLLRWMIPCSTVAVLLACAGRSSAEEPAARPAEPPKIDSAACGPSIESLVAALGDPIYAVRRRASRQLLTIGAPAKSALLSALQSDDAEIRRRVRLILPAVLAADFRARLEDFAARGTDSEAARLPGWKQYRAIAGNDRFARELFVQMARSEPLLLEGIDEGPAAAAQALTGRCAPLQQIFDAVVRWEDVRELDQISPPITLGTIGAMLLALSDPDVRPDSASQLVVLRLLKIQQVRTAMVSGSNAAAPLRRLAGRWVGHYRGAREARRCLDVSLGFGLIEGRATAIRLLRDSSQSVDVHEMSILTIARFGTADDLRVLAPLLADENPCTETTADKGTCRQEMRDVALSAMIHLVGQEPSDYGFAEPKAHRLTVFQPSSLRFATPARRADALAKWRKWYAAYQRGEVKSSPPKHREAPALPSDNDDTLGIE